MGRRCDWTNVKPPPADASRSLTEALLGCEMVKRGPSLSIRFDDRRDSDLAYKTLLGLRDSYKPERK
jgi:hypothetical protein